MKSEARDLNKNALAERLCAEYDGLRTPTRLTFVPKGEEAYAYLAESGTGRWFVKAHLVADEGAATRLDAALRATLALPLTGVVAPVPTRRGAATIRFAGYVVAVFPFLEGAASCWETPFTDADQTRAATLLAALHETAPAVLASFSLPQEDFILPHSDLLPRVLDQAAAMASPPAGSFADRARDVLLAQASDLRATLDRLENARPARLAQPLDYVVTHGDPNRANLLRDIEDGALHLVDWGALGVRPRERDLFFFTEAGFGDFLSAYVCALPQTPRLHADVFTFYAYEWAFQEIAEYGARLLFGHNEGREDKTSWADLCEYLPLRHREIARGETELRATLNKVLGVAERN